MALVTDNVSYIRQSKILNPTDAADLHITIAGCGTVGSNAGVCLARAGFKRFHLIDMDVVEPHNLPSQSFSKEHLGVEKTRALAHEMSRVADNLKITFGGELYGHETFPAGIIVSAVDSMKMRETLFRTSAQSNPNISLFIDFRMGGNTVKAYGLDPHGDRADQYLGTLYSSEEAEPVECGGRTFAPVGPLVGAFITQMVTKHIREDDHPFYYMEGDFDRFDFVPLGLPKIKED